MIALKRGELNIKSEKKGGENQYELYTKRIVLRAYCTNVKHHYTNFLLLYPGVHSSSFCCWMLKKEYDDVFS